MKQLKITALATAVFIICVLIAYHNTASLGYDRQYLIYYDSTGVEILDYRIDYQDIKDKINYFKDLMPDDFIAI